MFGHNSDDVIVCGRWVTKPTTSEKYQDHLLEQYSLFVGTSQQVSECRQNANNYLLT